MKNQLITAAVLFACTLSACRKCDDHVDPPVNCESVFCTANFAEVKLQVLDAAHQPVRLDSFVVTDMNGVPLPPAAGGIAVYGYPSNGDNGEYTVLNDAWRTGHQNTTVSVRALGFKNSAMVLNEVYQVQTDCCHVNKASGKDVIVLN